MFLSLNFVILFLFSIVLFSNIYNVMINIFIFMLILLFYLVIDFLNGKYFVYINKES